MTIILALCDPERGGGRGIKFVGYELSSLKVEEQMHTGSPFGANDKQFDLIRTMGVIFVFMLELNF